MTIRLITALVMTSALVFNATGLSAQMKIAVANSQQIIENLPEAKGIQAQMQKAKEAAEAEFAGKAQKFQADVADYDRKKDMMSPDKKKQTEQELQQKQAELQQYNQTKTQELQQKQLELFKPIEEKVLDAIQVVAKKEGYVAVFDKANSLSNIVLYADDSLDITFKVLDYLKTAKAAAEPKTESKK
ncbi:MAG: OmpH family outer membrane protein [Bacteroidetes bacterium]|nr:OmpH family outer membrane protein [Bacteroidota bacterium]